MKTKLNIEMYIDELHKMGIDIQLNKINGLVNDVPIMKQTHILLSFVGDKGLKLTAKGNLPSKVVKEISLCSPDLHTQSFLEVSKRFIEDEQVPVQRVRNLAEVAKIISTRSGKMKYGVMYKEFIHATPEEQYIYLFFCYGILNLGYFDGYQEEEITPKIFYLLLQYIRDSTSVFRESEVYLAFLYNDYPHLVEMIEDEIEVHTYDDDSLSTYAGIAQKRLFRNAYVPFGLLEEIEEGKGLFKTYETQKTVLLDALIIPRNSIEVENVLTVKKMKNLEQKAKELKIESDTLFVDIVFLLMLCMKDDLYEHEAAVDTIMSDKKIIGKIKEKHYDFYIALSHKVTDTFKYFTRLEVKGGSEGDMDRFKSWIDALYFLLPKSKPRNLFKTLVYTPVLFANRIAKLYDLDIQDASFESQLLATVDKDVGEDISAYFYMMDVLEKRSLKVKRITKEFEGIVKETLTLMNIAVMSIHTHERDGFI